MKKLICALLAGLLGFLVTYKIVTFDPKQYISGQYYTYTCHKMFCDVYFSSSIGEESYYTDIYQLIETSEPGQVIKIHLSGNGGQMSTVYHLANAIQQTKAEIDTIVEGPVYSAHAFIAMMGNKIIIQPYAQFLFHLPAVALQEGADPILPSQACYTLAGHYDRGQDSVKKCLDLNAGEQTMFDKMFKVYIAPFLTKQEIDDLYQGYDIYLPAQTLKDRLSGK